MIIIQIKMLPLFGFFKVYLDLIQSTWLEYLLTVHKKAIVK